MNISKKSIIVVLNIFVLFIISYITFDFQKYFYVVKHDYFWPYTNFEHFLRTGRIPAYISYSLLHNFLPRITNTNPQDFISGCGAIINVVIFLSLIITVTASFFMTSYNKYIIQNKESLLIIPLSFICLCFPFTQSDWYSIYFGFMNECVVFFDYYICLLFFFIMVLSIIKILQNEHIGKVSKFLIAVNSFLLGFWNELFNVTVFISLFFVSTFFGRKLNKDYFKLILFPFVCAFSLYYICSEWFSGKMGASHPQNWAYEFNQTFHNISHFMSCYTEHLFIQKVPLFLIIFILLIFLLKSRIINKINTVNKVCLSFLSGYLICNLSYIFFKEIANSYGLDYLFQRSIEEYVYCNILEFIIIIFLGCVYFQYKELRKYILVFIFIVTLFFSVNFNKHYNKIQEKNLNVKLLVYKIEKANVIYNYLGESTILPASFLNSSDLRNGDIYTLHDLFKYRYKEDFETFMQDKYFDSLYSLYHMYFENTYNTKFIGFQFKEDDYANNEYRKRLNILNEQIEDDETIIKNRVSFKSLDKYKNKKISLEEINKIPPTDENYDILLKTQAYINYRDGNLEVALKLYSEYLEIKNDDFDALYNLADIYMQLEDINKAETIYEKLHALDSNNLTFLYKLLLINYENKKDYNKALEICDLMINTQKDMYRLYANKGLVYYMSGNIEEAQKIFEFVSTKNSYIKEHIKNELQNEEIHLMEPMF